MNQDQDTNRNEKNVSVFAIYMYEQFDRIRHMHVEKKDIRHNIRLRFETLNAAVFMLINNSSFGTKISNFTTHGP